MSEAKEMSELIARNVTAPQQKKRASRSKGQNSISFTKPNQLSGYVDFKNL